MFATQRWGLRGRSIALCLVLILGAVLTVVLALSLRARHQALRHLAMHAEVYAAALGHNAEPAVLTRDTAALARVIESAAQDRELKQAQILGPEGDELAKLREDNNFASDFAITNALPAAPTYRSVVRQSVRQMLVVTPVWQRVNGGPAGGDRLASGPALRRNGAAPIGYVALTYSLRPIHNELRQQLYAAGMLGLLVIAAGVALTLFLVGHSLGPLHELVRTSTLIAGGERNRRVSERGVGEIGELARSFNTMAASLENSYSEIEKKVAARTVELNDKRIELEREVAERRQIAEALRDAKEAAEAGSRAKSEFLANISHEIRTPMNGIIGMTELLATTDLTTEQREYLTTAQSCSSALLALLNDVLDFSKIEAGKMELELTEFSLEVLLEGVLDLVGQASVDKSIGLYCAVDPQAPPQVIGDALRLRQILANLTGNAVKFTDRGHVLISVAETRPGIFRFAVQDTGIGIALERQQQIFESFTQADGATTRKYGGTGLGLAISRQLVDLMDGTIGVDSQPDRGSTFWFEVPLESVAGHQPLDATLHGRTIAVAVPESPGRDLLADACRAWGATVHAIPELPPADRIAQADAVLVDARLIDQADQLPDLPQPVVIGHPVRSVEAVILPKPWKPSALRNTLITLLGDPAPSDDGTAEPAPAAPDPQPAQTPPAPRVLLVEDNPINQQVARGILDRIGCAVDVAGNGRIALQHLAENRYDLVLLDIQMPEMDGFETIRAIRTDAGLAGLPVIAMTAHAMLGDREKCLAAGMDDYLTKPFRRDELDHIVRRWWKPPGPADDAPPAAEGFDLEHALGFLGGDQELLREVLVAFFDNVPVALAQLEEAARLADAHRLATAAVAFGDAAEYVGAQQVRETAAAIERLAQTGNLAAIPTQIDQLAEAVRQVRTLAGDLIGERRDS